MTDEVSRRRGRLQLLAVAALFFVPTLGAWFFVAYDWRPEGTTNHGVLIQPPERVMPTGWTWRSGEPLDADWFAGHWTVLAVRDSPCDDACREELDGTLRVRVALDRDAARVEPLLLQPEGVAAPADAPPVLRTATAPRAEIRRLLGAESRPQGVPEAETAWYLIDYQGFRMMAYPAPLDASDLLADLEQLLRIADPDVERYRRLRESDDG